ncbi:bifunctional DNA primase/polymerase [Amycolatopsis rhabdoformis]|uniref:Bifunctional DNA primase/polymerase n=1 Tax=Amycolatopsis rhabdoformis TaxID=1448059 RepID=A0ABZ1I6C1_9PSEU|nr:bifunctional DNA primase/polymerase [Amycolatopsis rhabdoformis]WSE29044.1 bifunctional DNA primase/polymerase [Amycolatopsis rhabdoformis]
MTIVDSTNPFQAWSLYLAAMGWPVFPLVPLRKQPAVRDWENRATTDPARIRRCWDEGDFWNVAVATGPAGLVVVDLDQPKPGQSGPDGATALTELAELRGGPLPATYTVTTPSGGRHLYYLAPAGTHLRSSAGQLASRVDVRAHGGYVVGPGSVTDVGGWELCDDTDPVELPGWLVQACAERASTAISAPREIHAADPNRYGMAALAGECDRVRTAAPEQHNAVLSSAAYTIGRKLGAELIDHATARTELTAAAGHMVAASCECTQREVTRVIAAGLTAGARNPVARRGKAA